MKNLIIAFFIVTNGFVLAMFDVPPTFSSEDLNVNFCLTAFGTGMFFGFLFIAADVVDRMFIDSK